MPGDLYPAESPLLCQRCKGEWTPVSSNHPRIPAIQLRSNIIPSEAQIYRQFEYLRDEERELKHYDDEITRLHLAVEQLRAQKSVLKRKTEERRSWLAPIRKVPREVLEQIFSYVCLHEHGWSLRIGTQYLGGPVFAPTHTLSRVSYHWRCLVTTQPPLWSTIFVDVSELYRDVGQLTDLYLRNSLDHPLRVVIHDSSGYSTPILGKCGLTIIRRLLSHHYRLEYLEVASDTLITSAAAGRTLSFPSLSTLYVHSGGYTGAKSFWNAIHKAPRLTEVQSEILNPSILPYHQLTTLEINTCCECKELFHILQFCTRLESLHLRELYPNVHWQPQHIDLPFLLSAICEWREEPSDDCHSILFEHLTLPSLTSVEIQDCFLDGYNGRRETWVPTSFMGMLIDSGCKPRRLTLRVPYHHLPFPEFAEMLELCPELTDLEIEMLDREGSHFTYDFLHTLLPHPSDQSQRLLLPNLKSLDITEWQIATSLLDMIETRAMSLSVPWTIHLRFKDEPESVVEIEKAVKDRAGALQEIGTTCYIR